MNVGVLGVKLIILAVFAAERFSFAILFSISDFGLLSKAFVSFFLDLCTRIMYHKTMERNTDFVYLDTFVWDTEKNELNKKKHGGLSFELASRVFNDPLLYNVYDYSHSDDEYREKYIGKIEGHYIVSVIATDRDNLIRLISARKADKMEVRCYEENAKRIQSY